MPCGLLALLLLFGLGLLGVDPVGQGGAGGGSFALDILSTRVIAAAKQDAVVSASELGVHQPVDQGVDGTAHIDSDETEHVEALR